MPRPEKVQVVAEIKERLEESQAVFVAEYAGLSVKEQQELRRGLRAADSEFKVVKMTLARLAASELGHDDLVDLLIGPTGLTFTTGDAAVAAKVLNEFAKAHDQLVLKGALYAGEMLPADRVAELAELEPRDVLLSRIAGLFQAPMANAASLFAAMPRNLASMLKQLLDRREADEPAPVEAEAEPAEAAPEAAEAEPAAPEAEAASEAAEAEPTEDEPEAAETKEAPADADPAEPKGEADDDAADEAAPDTAEPEGEADEAEEA
jgi:large subunit ribosomal protein L10